MRVAQIIDGVVVNVRVGPEGTDWAEGGRFVVAILSNADEVGTGLGYVQIGWRYVGGAFYPPGTLPESRYAAAGRAARLRAIAKLPPAEQAAALLLEDAR